MFGLGGSQDSPATNPLETSRCFLKLILFFHYLSLVLNSQTHKYLKYCFVVITNSIASDYVIFQNPFVSEMSQLDLKQENRDAKSRKLCTPPPLPGHCLPAPHPVSSQATSNQGRQMQDFKRPKGAMTKVSHPQCGA